MWILSPASTEACTSAINDLRDEFTRRFQYFSTHSSKLDVFAKPYSVSPEDSDAALQMELIELQCDSTRQHYYSNNDLLTFYTNRLHVTRYPQLAIYANSGVIHICETFFSKMKFAKNKCHTSLKEFFWENTLRLSTTSIVPNIEQLVDRV